MKNRSSVKLTLVKKHEVLQLSEPRGTEFPSEWYDLAVEDHFWVEWRFRAMKTLFRDLGINFDLPLLALDVGCGNGLLQKEFEATTAWTVDCADLNSDALTRISPGRGKVMYYDITEKKIPAAYDIVFALDVIEHLDQVEPFLKAAVFHLKPGGWLIVNVPALPALYSEYDRVVGHVRRYKKATLGGEFKNFEKESTHLRYWGMSLLPLGLARKWMLALRRRNGTFTSETVTQGFQPPTKWLNRLLGKIAAIETKILSKPLAGTSLLAAVRIKK